MNAWPFLNGFFSRVHPNVLNNFGRKKKTKLLPQLSFSCVLILPYWSSIGQCLFPKGMVKFLSLISSVFVSLITPGLNLHRLIDRGPRILLVCSLATQ